MNIHLCALLFYLTNVYTYISHIFVIWFKSFICFKIFAENIVTTRVMGLQNVQF